MEHESPEEARALGRNAKAPWEIPWRGLKEVLFRVWGEATKDEVNRASAAVAFWAFLALLPALIAVVSVYGLLADPTQIMAQLYSEQVTLPDSVRHLIAKELSNIISSSRVGLTVSAVVSLLVSWFSASKGVLSLIEAVNVAYNERETRGWLTRRWLAIRYTAGLSAFVSTSILVITVLPAIFGLFGLEEVVRLLRWPLLAVSVMLALGILYRYAPNRTPARWPWVFWGSGFGAGSWLIVSLGLATYVDSFTRFSATYGALGAIVALLLWFYLSAYVIVIGAELNAELEHQTAVDSTIGEPKPIGERGAVMADNIAMPEPSTPLSDSLKRALKNARSGRRGKS